MKRESIKLLKLKDLVFSYLRQFRNNFFYEKKIENLKENQY